MLYNDWLIEINNQFRGLTKPGETLPPSLSSSDSGNIPPRICQAKIPGSSSHHKHQKQKAVIADV